MANENPGLWSYIAAAFNWKVPFPGLGQLPLNKLLLAVIGVLGLANPGFWFLGAALETGYLLTLAGNERFQRLVQGLRMGKKNAPGAGGRMDVGPEKQLKLVASLDPASRSRYQNLAQTCSEVLKTAEGASSPAGATGMLQSGGLGQLLWIFLKLLVSRERITMILSQTSRAHIEAEILEAQEKLRPMDPASPVARSLKGTTEIQQKRLDNLVRAQESLSITEAELERIEKQVALIREEVTVSADPQFLSVRLDGIMDSLSGTTRWMSEHEELFGGLDAGIQIGPASETEGPGRRRGS